MGVANRECLNAAPAWALCKFQSSRKLAGSARAFPCERGADFQYASCSRASVVLILDMEAPQWLLQGR